LNKGSELKTSANSLAVKSSTERSRERFHDRAVRARLPTKTSKSFVRSFSILREQRWRRKSTNTSRSLTAN